MEQQLKIYVNIPGHRYAGLMSYFVQVVSNLNVVKNTSNKLYVKFDENMRYQDLRYGKNVWDYYFKQPFNFSSEEVAGAIKIKDVWFEGNLSIPPRLTQDVIQDSGEIIKTYIHLKSHVQEKIEQFLERNTQPSDKILAVHKRGTDHICDAPLLNTQTYLKCIDEYIDSYDKLLLCTDEEYIIDEFKQRYGDKLIYYSSIRATENNNIGIHQSVGLLDPYKMGEDVIIETYLMSRSDFLIKTVSNVSNAALLINPSLKYVEIDTHIDYNC
jgi:hypothetical protein